MNLKTVFSATALLCSLAATAVAQSATPSPSPAEAPQASPTPQTSPRPMKLRVSQGVAQQNLLHKVEPEYPAEARAQHITGVVILGITITERGTVENLHLIEGDPVLARASMEAVQQWRYKPYMLKGEPVKVETTVKISFHM